MIMATEKPDAAPKPAKTKPKPVSRDRGNLPAITPPPPSQAGAVRPKIGQKNSLAQVVKLQQTCYDKALTPEISPSELSSLSRAWKELEEQTRIIRGRPLPGSLRPEQTKKTKASQPWTPSE